MCSKTTWHHQASDVTTSVSLIISCVLKQSVLATRMLASLPSLSFFKISWNLHLPLRPVNEHRWQIIVRILQGCAVVSALFPNRLASAARTSFNSFSVTTCFDSRPDLEDTRHNLVRHPLNVLGPVHTVLLRAFLVISEGAMNQQNHQEYDITVDHEVVKQSRHCPEERT